MQRLPYMRFWFFLILISFFARSLSHASFAQTVPPATRSVHLPLVLRILPTETPTPTATATATPPPPTATSDPSQGDIRPPQIITWSFSPTVVNTKDSDQTIAVIAHFTDDLSGLETGPGLPTQASFYSPSKQQYSTVVFHFPEDLISGTARDGIYQSKLTVKRFSQSGEWRLERLILSDEVGNRKDMTSADLSALGLPISFQVTN